MLHWLQTLAIIIIKNNLNKSMKAGGLQSNKVNPIQSIPTIFSNLLYVWDIFLESILIHSFASMEPSSSCHHSQLQVFKSMVWIYSSLGVNESRKLLADCSLNSLHEWSSHNHVLEMLLLSPK